MRLSEVERTAGLQHEIDPQISPRDVPGFVVSAGRDPSTIDEDRVAVDPDLAGIAAVDRVELEEWAAVAASAFRSLMWASSMPS